MVLGESTYVVRHTRTDIYVSVSRVSSYVQGRISQEGHIQHILAGLSGGDPTLPCRVIYTSAKSQRFLSPPSDKGAWKTARYAYGVSSSTTR